jgi:hypothetical protein
VRGIYCTKDTFVTTALKAGVKVAWLENRTGVGYATLKRHYGKWFHEAFMRGVRFFGGGHRVSSLIMSRAERLICFVDSVHTEEDADIVVEF